MNIFLCISFGTLLVTWDICHKNGMVWLEKISVSDRVGRWTERAAVVGLILLIIDEFGLLLNEWNLPAGPFEWIRTFMEFPGIDYLIYFFNFYLASVGVWRFIHGLDMGDKIRDAAAVNRKYLLDLLAFANLLLLVTALQIVVWNSSYGPAFILLISLLLWQFGDVKHKYYSEASVRQNPDEKIFTLNKYLFIFAMISLETMITKVGLLLILIPKTANWLLAKVRALLKRPESAEMDILQVEDMPKRIFDGDIWSLIGFMFLCASGFTSFIFWQAHQGPLPPSGSAYPKTETISFLYTLDILFMTYAITRKRAPTLVILSMAFLIFTRYVLPLSQADWFYPPSIPPGFSTISAIADFSNRTFPMIFGFAFHAAIFLAFLLLILQARFFDRLLKHNDDSSRVKLGAVSFFNSIFAVLICVGWLFGGLMAYMFFHAQYPEGKTALSPEVFLLETKNAGKLSLVIMGLLSSFFMFMVNKKSMTELDILHRDIHEWQGKDGIDAMSRACPWLKWMAYAWGQKSCKINGFSIVCILNALTVLLLAFCLK